MRDRALRRDHRYLRRGRRDRRRSAAALPPPMQIADRPDALPRHVRTDAAALLREDGWRRARVCAGAGRQARASRRPSGHRARARAAGGRTAPTRELRVRCSAGLLRPLAGARRGSGDRLRARSSTGWCAPRRPGFASTTRCRSRCSSRRRETRCGARCGRMETLLADLPAVHADGRRRRVGAHGRDLGPRDSLHPLTDRVATRATDSRRTGACWGWPNPQKSAGFCTLLWFSVTIDDSRRDEKAPYTAGSSTRAGS